VDTLLNYEKMGLSNKKGWWLDILLNHENKKQWKCETEGHGAVGVIGAPQAKGEEAVVIIDPSNEFNMGRSTSVTM
jgi:hypothetical protein